ncbi:unnamed protein product [Prunus brigantina]
MKRKFMMLTLLISGPKQPGNDIDVYLEPLIDDLKSLWDGIRGVYDAHNGEYFTLRAALMWTINDFPAYGNLSGCVVKGYKACPICGDDTPSHRLKNGHKICYIGHRKWLPINHPYRRQRAAFNGKPEYGTPPEPLTGEEVLHMVEDGDSVCWKKKSIFFDLEYWKYLHALDVMHIEKNVCDSIIGTLLEIPGKNKDGIAARLDLLNMGVKTDLQPEYGERRTRLPPGPWNLSRAEKREVQSELEEDNHGVSRKFKAQDDVRTTQNSGVYLLAHTMQVASAKDKNPILSNMGFYGVIQEIWDLDYQKFTIPVFRCDWIDSASGLVVDELGFTLVDLSKIGHRNDQFVLASQVKQVFFVDDPMHRGWSVVLSMPNREYNDAIGDDVLGDVIIECEPFTRGMPNVDTFDELVGELGGQNIRDGCEDIWIE